MVYLAELLVVATDRLKSVRIPAWNVHREHGHQTRLSLLSVAQESDSIVFSMRWGAVLLKHKKNSSWDNLRMSGSGL